MPSFEPKLEVVQMWKNLQNKVQYAEFKQRRNRQGDSPIELQLKEIAGYLLKVTTLFQCFKYTAMTQILQGCHFRGNVDYMLRGESCRDLITVTTNQYYLRETPSQLVRLQFLCSRIFRPFTLFQISEVSLAIYSYKVTSYIVQSTFTTPKLPKSATRKSHMHF